MLAVISSHDFFFAKSRVVEFVSATVFFSFYIFMIIGFPLLVGEL